MSWFAFAFLAAIFDALKNVCSKTSLKHIDSYIVGFSMAFVTFVLVLLRISAIEIPTVIGYTFWLALVICGSLEVTSIILYMLAIQQSELSLTIPMLSFTPIFLLMTAPLLVGDYPTRYDIIGVLLIVSGTYLLYAGNAAQGYLAPLKALAHAKGPGLMLIVAVIYNFIAEVDKIGIQHSSPFFWLLARQGVTTLFLLLVMLYKSIDHLKQILHLWKDLVYVGGFHGLALGCCLGGIQIAPVFNVIAIKRTAVLLSVLFGHVIFKEQHIKARFTGATVMMVGVFFITLL